MAATGELRPLGAGDGAMRRLLGLSAIGAALALGLAARLGGGPPSPPSAELVVDPNTAPAAVLSALPRIGPTLAARIVAARVERPFDSLDDLDRRVRGIGPATAEALRPSLRFDPIPNPGQGRPD